MGLKESLKRFVRRITLCSEGEHAKVIKDGCNLHKVFAYKLKCTDCDKTITGDWEVEVNDKVLGFDSHTLKSLCPIDHAQIILSLSATSADDESLALIYGAITDFYEQ